jgi:hypothetical protein
MTEGRGHGADHQWHGFPVLYHAAKLSVGKGKVGESPEGKTGSIFFQIGRFFDLYDRQVGIAMEALGLQSMKDTKGE